MAEVGGHQMQDAGCHLRVQVSTRGASVTTRTGVWHALLASSGLPVSEGACCQHSTYYFSIWHQETPNARGSCVHQRGLTAPSKTLSHNFVDDTYVLDDQIT